MDAGLELIRLSAAVFSVPESGTSSFAGLPVSQANGQARGERRSGSTRDTQVSGDRSGTARDTQVSSGTEALMSGLRARNPSHLCSLGGKRPDSAWAWGRVYEE